MLDKTILGTDLYNRAQSFNDVDIAPGDLEARRQAWWQTIAEGIIEHIKAAAVVTVETTGTAAAQAGTGTIE